MQFAGHAHVLQGTVDSLESVIDLLTKEGITSRESPDLFARSYAHFGIDEARDLRARAASRGVQGPRVFVIAADAMTQEAQHALLKTVEEPPGDTRFFFVVPSPETLLPTLRSRVQITHAVRLTARATVHATVHAAPDPAAFVSAAPSARLTLLEPLLEKGKDEVRDMGAILTFLSSLEHALEKSGNRDGLEAVYRARKYAGDKGALLKPLLEQVALLV